MASSFWPRLIVFTHEKLYEIMEWMNIYYIKLALVYISKIITCDIRDISTEHDHYIHKDKKNYQLILEHFQINKKDNTQYFSKIWNE